MTNEEIINFTQENYPYIIVFFLILFSVEIISKIAVISKKLPAFLVTFEHYKPIAFCRKFLIYIFPVLLIAGFIFIYRNSLLTFGITGLFIIFCTMYSMILILLLLSRIQNTTSLQIKYKKEKQNLHVETFENIYKAIDTLGKAIRENDKK